MEKQEDTNDNNIRVSKLDDAYNIKFALLCQLFESSIKQKTKAKAK